MTNRSTYGVFEGIHGAPKGEDASKAKLTEDQVLEIRALFKQRVRQTEIANLFGVSTTTIYKIVNRETWMHI